MRGRPILYQDFRRGLNLRDQPYALDSSECRDCQNVIFSESGAVDKRFGSTQFSDTGLTETPKSLHYFEQESGTDWLISTGGTKIFKSSTSGVTSEIQGAAMTSDLKWDWTAFKSSGGQGPLWGMNGTNTPQYWTGAGNTADWTATSGTVPNGKYLTIYGNRVYVTGVAANPSYVYFSELGEPRNWPTNNYVEVRSQDGDSINGIGIVGDYLVIFKTRAIWVIYDSNSGANRQIDDSIGCVSDRSIVSTEYGLIFMAERGVYWTNGQSVKTISDNIAPFWDDLPTQYLSNAAACYKDGHYYLAVTGSGATVNDTVLDCDLRTISGNEASWTKHTLPVNEFAVFGDTIYTANSGAAKVMKVFDSTVYQDDGVNYEGSWVSPWYAFGSPYTNTRVREIAFDGSGTVDYYYSKDFHPALSEKTTGDFTVGSELWAESGRLFAEEGYLWAGGPTAGSASIYEPGVGKAWSVKLVNDENSGFSLFSMTWAIQKRKD